MTDYNDGKWHAHNGGECPVHPESIGDITYVDGDLRRNAKLGGAVWEDHLMFRVTKPYVEPKKPREMWSDDEGTLWRTFEEAESWCKDENRPTKWIEVIE